MIVRLAVVGLAAFFFYLYERRTDQLLQAKDAEIERLIQERHRLEELVLKAEVGSRTG